MKTHTLKTAAVPAATLTVLALLSACDAGEASDPDTETAAQVTPIAVQVATPVRSDIYATYAATASITSDFDAPVTARVAGEVVELVVEEGERVAPGQVLARLDGERARLEMLSAKANLDRSKKEYRRNVDLHRRGIVSTATFEDLKFDLESLQATYELTRLNYDYSNIRATISGVVSSREIKPGENLRIGQVAFRITETSELIAYLQIPQAELPKFVAGHSATLAVAAIPGERFDATIVRISPTIDAKSGTFRATALIDNSNGDLAPGMFGRFTVAYEKHTNALVIPAQAVIDEDQQRTVYVVRDGAVFRRGVDTGIESDGHVEILGGLQEGEAIVVVGHSGLRDGSKVLANAASTDHFTG